MANEKDKTDPPLQGAKNALADYAPKLDLVGPTVDDDIRRAIGRYGAEAVKEAVKEATKAKRGRKREPDWSELKETIEAHARQWLNGEDPFEAVSNYAIAKAFADKNPGQSAISTHKRIERKLSRGPHDRRWFTLVSAEMQGREAYSYLAYMRTLEALAELPDAEAAQVWKMILKRARSVLVDYAAREGHPPPDELTFAEVEEATKKAEGNALARLGPPRGLFGSIKPHGGSRR